MEHAGLGTWLSVGARAWLRRPTAQPYRLKSINLPSTPMAWLLAAGLLLLGDLHAQDFIQFPATRLYVPQTVIPGPAPRYASGDQACAAIADTYNANGAGSPYRIEMHNTAYAETAEGKGCAFDYVYFGGAGGNPDGTVTHTFAANWVLPTSQCPSDHDSISGPGGVPYCKRRAVGIKECSQCPTPEVGNPIDVAAAEKVYRATDIDEVDGLGFARTYRSRMRHKPQDGLGPAWSADHFQRLEVSSGASGETIAVSAALANGRPVLFLPAGATGQWAVEPDQRAFNLTVAGVGYVLTRKDGTIERYDQTGRLLTVERSDGVVLSYHYGDGLLREVRNAKGRRLTFGYDTRRRLTSVQSNSGQTVTFGYSTSNLLSWAATAGYTERYTYEQRFGFPSYLTAVDSDQVGAIARYSYDTEGVPTATQRGSGSDIYAVGYPVTGQIKVTTPLGVVSTYYFHTDLGMRVIDRIVSECANCTTKDQRYARDANLNLIEVWTSGEKECRRYDQGRNLAVETIEGASSDVACTSMSGGAFVRRTATAWHSTLRKPIEKKTYKADGTLVETTTWTYNARGQGQTVAVHDVAADVSRTSITTYCEEVDVSEGICPLAGLVLSVDGPRDDVADATSYQYYSADDSNCAASPVTCSWRKGDLWKVTNALGQVTETLRYDGAGRVLSVKDANNIVTDFEYHPRGWLTARKVRGADTASESDDQITTIAYYPTGLVSSITLPDGSFTSYVYDAASRLTDIVDADGNSIHYTLDNSGNRTKEDVKGEDGTLRRTLSRVYNQLGQLQKAKDAGNHPTGFSYDANGNLDKTTDALGRVADNDYDPLNRLSKTIQDVGGIAATTQFKYDAQDNLTEVVDPKGLSTKYQYNAFGDLKRLESPDTGVATYDYDAAGNRTGALDARGEPSSYSYDALNRLTAIGYSDTALNVGYNYDTVQPDCAAGETFAVGRLTRMTDGSGATAYCYDRFGNLTRKVQTTNGQSFTLRYAYTKAGQLTGIEYPDGTQVDYVRDGLGRTTEVGVTPSGGGRQVLLTGASYHAFGPVAGWMFGNGRTISRTLDLDYRPKTILSTGAGAGGLNLGFGWDAVGNIVSLHTSGLEQPPRVSLDYDTLNRLTAFRDGAAGAAIEQYAYDATGNRTFFTNAHGTHAYSYATDSHRLTAVGAEARTFDAMGNTTSIGGTEREFAYNAAGRMSEVQHDNVVAMQYGYNGKGEQVRKHLGTSNTYALYDESGQWLGEYGKARAPNQQIVWLDSLPVGVIANGQLNYIEADHLGTPRAVIDPQRDVAVWTWDIAGEAFGNSAPNQDPDGDGTALVLDMRFPGQRYDAAKGLNYNYFRDYDLDGGRYIESDPIGLAGGISTYAYVSSRPLNDYDPTGLEGANDFPRRIDPVTARRMRQRECANRAFWHAYGDMRAANWKQSDKYFHCRANCEATKCGPAGYEEACEMSDNREAFDQTFKGDSADASAADQAANRHGREGARSRPNQSCQITCAPYRPKGLPSQY